MSGTLQSIAVGGLGLCLLEVVLTSKTAASRLSGGGTDAAAVLARFVDPTVPLIPPKAADASTTTSTTAPASTPAVPPGGSLA